MEKCRRMKRQQFSSKNWMYSWQWKSSRIRQQCCRLQNFARITDFHVSGPMVKNHVIGNGVRIQCIMENYAPIVVPGLSTTSSSSSLSGSTPPTSLPQESTGSTPVQASIESERADEQGRRNPVPDTTKNPKPNKKEDHEQERVTSSSSEIPEWLQEFMENFVDESVLEPHGAWVPVLSDSHASSSHEPSLEPLRRVVPGNHSVYTHFQINRNCEICQKTKITRASYRRRIGEVVPRAKNLVTW